MRLREAEAREADDHLVDALGGLLVDAVGGGRALDEALVVGLDRRRRALAAHRPPQPLGLAGREAGERHRDLDHLVLEDDRAERVAQHRLERRVVVGHDVVRVHAQPLAARDVRVDGAAEDRAGPHDRDLDREVVEALGARAVQRLHLRARLDLEDAHRVGLLDRRRRSRRRRTGSARGRSARCACARSSPRSARPRTASRARAGRSSGSPRRRTSPCPTGRAGGPPSPRGRPGSSRSAGASRRSSRPSAGRGGAAARRPRRTAARASPSGRAARRSAPRPRAHALGDLSAGSLPLTIASHSSVDMANGARLSGSLSSAGGPPGSSPSAASTSATVPRTANGSAPRATRSSSPAGRPSALPSSRIAAARLERRERGDQRRPLAPVALVDARDQDLADVAREVEVDVRQRGQLLVQEAAEEQLVRHRVDVREAGEVADDRGHRRAAAAAGRQQRAHRRRPADLDRHVARELEQVAVQQEEAGEAEAVDHPQLLLEAARRGGGARARVALVQLGPAQLGERGDARPRPPSRDSGSRGRSSGRTAAGSPARASAPPRPGARGSGRPSPAARRARARRCRGAAAPRPRATCGCAAPRTRPAAAPARARARGRCRSPPWGPSAAPPARPAGGCGRGRRAGTAAAARPAGGRGRSASSSVRSVGSSCTPRVAQPLRQTSPSACSARVSSEIDGGISARRIRVPTIDWCRPRTIPASPRPVHACAHARG